MKRNSIHIAEQFRSLDRLHAPDQRSDPLDGQEQHALANHHADVARIALSDWVPEAVAIQFETARNLYLYAWHVYRFYPVSEMQALSTLEFGLRERLPARLPKKYQRLSAEQPMLGGLLRYAIDQALIRNDGFRRWHVSCEARARDRRQFELFNLMREQGLDVVEVDPDEHVEVTESDRDWDLLGVLRESLPHRRNQRAHGGPELNRFALNTIELVAEILNQLYPADQSSAL